MSDNTTIKNAFVAAGLNSVSSVQDALLNQMAENYDREQAGKDAAARAAAVAKKDAALTASIKVAQLLLVDVCEQEASAAFARRLAAEQAKTAPKGVATPKAPQNCAKQAHEEVVDLLPWGDFVAQCANRLARQDEDYEDRMQAGFLASLEATAAGKSPQSVAFAIRNAVALRENAFETPVSLLAGVDEDGEAEGLDETLERVGIEVAIADALALENVEALAKQELDAWIAKECECEQALVYCNPGTPRFTRLLKDLDEAKTRGQEIMAAILEYQESAKIVHEPDFEANRPLFLMGVPQGNGDGAVPYSSITGFDLCGVYEDEYVSDWETQEHDKAGTPIMLNGQALWAFEQPSDPTSIREMPEGCWQAIRETWGKDNFVPVLNGIMAALPRHDDVAKASALKFLGGHVENRELASRDEFYAVAVPILFQAAIGVDMEELALSAVEFGEGQIGAAGNDDDLAEIASRLWPDGDWSEMLPSIVWPTGTVPAAVSFGSKPFETAVFQNAAVKAAQNGASWKEASSAGYDAWHKVRDSKPAFSLRAKAERQIVEQGLDDKAAAQLRKDTGKAARAIDLFTSETSGKVVGLTATAVKVNGKGKIVTLPFNQAIVQCGKLHVGRDARKEQSLVAALKGIGDTQATILADGLASVFAYRREHCRR
jgi:hypothetical protein